MGDEILPRGRASGVDVEHLIFQVWTLRDGRIVRAAMFCDEEAALEAARLAE